MMAATIWNVPPRFGRLSSRAEVRHRRAALHQHPFLADPGFAGMSTVRQSNSNDRSPAVRSAKRLAAVAPFPTSRAAIKLLRSSPRAPSRPIGCNAFQAGLLSCAVLYGFTRDPRVDHVTGFRDLACHSRVAGLHLPNGSAQQSSHGALAVRAFAAPPDASHAGSAHLCAAGDAEHVHRARRQVQHDAVAEPHRFIGAGLRPGRRAGW